MTDLREATESQAAAWQPDWNARLHAWYKHSDVPAEWLAQQVAGRMAMQLGNQNGTVFAVTSDGAVIGMLAVAVFEEAGSVGAMINDIRIDEQFRRQGHGREALRLAEDWARGRGATTMWLLTDPADRAHAALFAGYPVRAHQMIKELSAWAELADGLVGRPMTEDEFIGWRAKSVAGYAADMSDSGSASAEEAASSSAAQFDQLLPDGLDTANHSFLCLDAGGEQVATNWICHNRKPGMSWVYGVEVSDGQRGKGYGRAAMVIGENSTLNAGDTHLALNVFGHNTVAISMYERMGYRAYDHGRSADL